MSAWSRWPSKYGPFHDYYEPLEARFEQEDPREGEQEPNTDSDSEEGENGEKKEEASWDLRRLQRQKKEFNGFTTRYGHFLQILNPSSPTLSNSNNSVTLPGSSMISM